MCNQEVEIMTTQITFSVRTNKEELLEKLEEDAQKQRRSRNFIVNDILLKHYKLIGDSD
jgi:hypothetical protein